MNKNIELLAPAGNEESFKAAVNAGADAVYMGLGKHNARVMARNFTLKSYIECINYAHIRGVKVYLTLNTLLQDNEIKEAVDMVIKLYEAGLDAVIIQDIGLAEIIHKLMPNLHMHASTQMSAYSLEQVRFLEKLGFKRVVLARELTLEEIKYITDNTNVEIEAFIHGALCVSVSGQCLLSLAIGTRSANRGACAQPCRMRYTLYKGNEKKSPRTYLLSKKDIYGLDILDKIIESNITSLKIEGRNKTPEYVALVVSTYRKYIDKYIKENKLNIQKNDEKKLLQMFNRNGKSFGYLNGVRYKDSITTLSPKNTGIFLGNVIEKKGDYIKIKLEDEISLHDGIEIHSKKGVASNIVTCIKDNNMRLLNRDCKKGDIVYLGDIKENYIISRDEVYKTSNYKLKQELQNKYIQKNIRQRSLVLTISIKRDLPVALSTIINGQTYTYNTNLIPQEAISRSITPEDIYGVFSKTQDTGIKFEKIDALIENGLFLKISELNEIRRNFVDEVENKLKIKNDITNISSNLERALNLQENLKTQASLQPQKILSIYRYDKDKDYVKEYFNKYKTNFERIDFQISDFVKNENDILHKYSKYSLGINISNFVLENLDKYIENNLEKLLKEGVNTIVLGTTRYIDMILSLKNRYEFTLIADYSLNITNSYSAILYNSLGFDVITPGFDSNNEQINRLNQYVNVELVDDYITAMTSRYCILGAFIENRMENSVCSAPCTLKEEYYIEDTYGERYDIVCDNIDCVMKILKSHKLERERLDKNLSHIRNNMI